ncbi:hypothetical protein ACFYKX_14060 [Cytobacillus sp. FJAT-54145]|uniref:Uncharacterized protein n=1 Tax=Cytobacillus spartinae TaxID=3299023 RepID=A0ABW6KBV9_9BACI
MKKIIAASLLTLTLVGATGIPSQHGTELSGIPSQHSIKQEYELAGIPSQHSIEEVYLFGIPSQH